MFTSSGGRARQRGIATTPSPFVEDLLAADSKVEPSLLKTGDHKPLGLPIPRSRYYDPEFAALEKERIWKKCWQYACSEEDIPQVGDRVDYNVAGLSFFIVRDKPDHFRAFYNSCPHRGTSLCESQGSGGAIVCPYHGWSWKLDGTVKNIPCRWDFDHLTDEQLRLPEVLLERWGGFIFINPDPKAGSLSDALGVLPEQMREFEPERRYSILHIRKKVRCNWKILPEAFLEGYHLFQTHPQALAFNGDANTQYEIWDDGKSHVSRLIGPAAVPSPLLGEKASARQAAIDAMNAFALALGPGVKLRNPNDYEEFGRAEVAQWRREVVGERYGHDFSKASDAQMLDSIQFFMFPNFAPWGGEGIPLVYQFGPLGDDPNESVLSTRLTAPIPDHGPRPPAAPRIDLDFDDTFSSLPEMGVLGAVFDQDLANFPRVQRGLKQGSDAFRYLNLSQYQERRLQHFEEVLARYLGV